MQQQIENVELRMKNELGAVGFSILHSSFSIQQRIGLNLGAVFAGNVGSAVRKEYTVMGDAVNVAARVMSKAAWGEIWCSAAAAQAIAARMSCDPRGSMALKGKAVPLELFRLVGERDMADVGVAVGEGPLIGRADELAQLRDHLRAALGGAGRAVRVAGEAGVGKSRLTATLIDEAVAAGARVIPAACFSYTSSIPYTAWAEWLKALSGFVAGDGEAAREHKLAALLADLGPGMDEWLPLLGDLARLDIPDNRLTRGLDPQMRQTRRFELLEQLLLRAAASGPVVALFEDLHWADPISLDLWRRVVGALAGACRAAAGRASPGPGAGGCCRWRACAGAQGALGRESSDLAAALTGGVELPALMLEQLVQRAGGNPLFLAELLRAVSAESSRLAIGNCGESPINLQSLICNLQSMSCPTA